MEMTAKELRDQEGIIREAIWNFSIELVEIYSSKKAYEYLLTLMAKETKDYIDATDKKFNSNTEDQFIFALNELLPESIREADVLTSSYKKFKAKTIACDWGFIVDILVDDMLKSDKDSQIDSFYQNGLNPLINQYLPKGNISVFNPFAGIGSFALSLNDGCEYYGQELNRHVWAIGFMRLFIRRKISSTQLICGDSLAIKLSKTFNSAVFFPPVDLGNKTRYDDYLLFDLVEKAVDDEGIIIWFVPPSFLRNEINKGLIQRWILNDWIEAIVQLPNRISNNNNLSFACIVLNKNKKSLIGKVKISDISTEYSSNRLFNYINYDNVFDRLASDSDLTIVVDIDKIIETDAYYDLRPSLYKLNEHIAQLEYSTSLNEVLSERKGVKKESEVYKLVTASDLKDDFLECVTSYKDVKPTKLEPTKTHKIVEPSSLLISAVGEKLKPTYYKGAEAIAISPSILAYKIDDSIVDPEYLINQLISSDFERQLKLVRKSMTALVRLNKDDFLKLVINSNASIDQQRTIVNEIKDGLIQEKLDEIHKLKAKHNLGENNNEQNALLRHAISLKLSNLLNSVKSIHEILDKQVFEKYSDLQFLKKNESLKTNLKEYVDMAQKDAISIYNTVSISKKGMDGILSLEPVKIKFLEYIGNYKKRIEARETRNFEISLDIDFENLIIDEEHFAMPLVKTHPDILDILFDNFIENAVKHAFTGEGPFKICILVRADGPGNGDFLSISVSNNGERLPKGFSQEIFVQKGRSLNDGEGLGGWQIDQIIKKLGGHWDEIDDEQDDMGVWKIVTDMSTTFNFDIPCYYE